MKTGIQKRIVRRIPSCRGSVIPEKSGIQKVTYSPPMTSPGKQPCVYILANKRNGTVYIGVTSDLKKRVSQHKEGIIPGFSADYGATRLVWFEEHPSMDCAITREKQLKKWNRAWKLRLIEQTNPEWKDLFEDIC